MAKLDPELLATVRQMNERRKEACTLARTIQLKARTHVQFDVSEMETAVVTIETLLEEIDRMRGK